jgi:hypothetical protein
LGVWAGKSTALKEEEGRLRNLKREEEHDHQNYICRKELGDFTSPEQLEDWLTGDTIKHWLNNEHHLFLLLDSIDEGN